MASKRPMGRALRDGALWITANALVLALPLGLRADPSAPPAPAAPLTITRPDMSDAAARRAAIRATILDARLEELRAGLKLSPAQEAFWPSVADAIRNLDKARGRRFRQQLEAAANSIDGLKMQGEHMARVGAAMARLADATNPLVASLTPDQKSRLPTLLQRVRPRKLIARAFELPMDTAANGFEQRRMGGAVGVATPGMAAPSMGAAASQSTTPPTTAAKDEPGKPGAGGAAAQSQPDDDDD